MECYQWCYGACGYHFPRSSCPPEMGYNDSDKDPIRTSSLVGMCFFKHHSFFHSFLPSSVMTSSTAETSQKFTFRDVLVTVATSGASVLNVFLGGAMTVALPTIGKDLSFKQEELQWPINVYALAFGCLLLFFGRVGDIVGGRAMFMIGTVWFAIWSIAAAFAPGVVTFIIFSGLQGLGAAAYTPASIRIITGHFPPGRKRNEAIGVFSAGQPVGYIIGLVAGGLLADSGATWRSIFYIQTGLAVAFAALAWFALGKIENETRYVKGLDWGGAFLSTTGVGLLTYSLADSTASSRGWAEPRIPATFCASLVLIAMFVFYELYREKRDLSVLLPPSMWSRPGAKLSSFTLLVFFTWFSFNTIDYYLTLYFQQVKLYSPFTTALYFIPTAIAGFIVNVVAGFTMTRVPGQYIIYVGLTGSVVAPMIFVWMDLDTSYWTMPFIMLLIVVGADAVYPVGNLQVCSAFDADSQALAGGVFSVATRLGTSIGLAVCTAISSSVSDRYLNMHPEFVESTPEVLWEGFKAAGWTCFGASCIAMAIAVTRLRNLGIVGEKKVLEDIAISPDVLAGEKELVEKV